MKIKKLTFLTFATIPLFFVSCGGDSTDMDDFLDKYEKRDQKNDSGNNSNRRGSTDSTDMDDFLDKYEEVVRGYESIARSGDLSVSHMSEISKHLLELAEVMDKNKENDEVTIAHITKLNSLINRLNIAMQKINLQ